MINNVRRKILSLLLFRQGCSKKSFRFSSKCSISFILIITYLLTLMPVTRTDVYAGAGSSGGSSVYTSFSPINEDPISNAGQPVSFIEPGVSGIAITNADNANGQWQWFNGVQWLNINVYTENFSLLIGSAIPVRFLPNPDWNGVSTINYVRYIHPTNLQPNHINAGFNSTDSNYCEQIMRTAEIQVIPVNDAPYITEVGGGRYLEFSNTAAHATYPALNIYSSSFTFESWVRVGGNQNSWERIFDTSYGPDNFNLHLAFEGGSGRMVLEALPQKGFRTHTYQAKSLEPFPINQWVHVAVVYNHTQKKAFMYWNGVQKAVGTMDLTNMANAGAFNSGINTRPINYLGRSTWANDGYFKGGMRDVRFWNKAKTQSEIINQMNAILVSNEPNLILQYRFNEGTGTILPSTGSVATATTLHNTTWGTNLGFSSSTTVQQGNSVTKEFKVYDVDNDLDTLSITAVSSNQVLLPNSNIVIAGSGSDRTIIINPVEGENGTASVFITVSDGGHSFQSSFLLTVTPSQSAELAFITPSAGLVEPGFNRNRTSYNIHVPNKTGSTTNSNINITVRASNPDAMNIFATSPGLIVSPPMALGNGDVRFSISGLIAGITRPMTIRVVDKFNTGNFKDYNLNIAMYPANDANLAGVNGLRLLDAHNDVPIPISPVYNANISSYTSKVSSTTSTVKIAVEKSSMFATVKINNVNAGTSNSTTATENVNLQYGENNIEVLVTAEDGRNTRAYSICIVRELSSNANLTSLTTNPSGIAPVFDPNQLEYTLKVTNGTTNAVFTPTADTRAAIRINGTPHNSGVPFTAGGLAVGNNVFVIEVTAQDGITKKTTKLMILRAPSDVADLESLIISNGQLLPDFENNVTAYTIEVDNSISSISIRPKLMDENAHVRIDGNIHVNNTNYVKALGIGINTAKIEVTSQSGLRKKETIINIIRKASSNADLSSLVLSSGTIDPVFNSQQTWYTATVANNVSQLTITSIAEHMGADLTINRNKVSSGQAKTVNLDVGLNKFNICVLAEDRVTTKNYTIVIVRSASSDTGLTNISISGKPLTSGFDISTSEYYEYVANNVSSVSVSAITSDPGASYTVNGRQSTGSVPVSLLVYDNTENTINKVNIVVTAADGITKKTYTINIIRAASNNSNLFVMRIFDDLNNNIQLTPGFAATTMNYNTNVASSVDAVKLDLVTENPNASINIYKNGELVLDIDHITLVEGLNVIEIFVTAQDGSMKCYTVSLIKDLSKDATLRALTVTSGVHFSWHQVLCRVFTNTQLM